MVNSFNFMNGLYLPKVYGFYSLGRYSKDPSIPFEILEASEITAPSLNNYMSFKVGDGISMSEKIR
jgi:hypothetical protein